MKERGFSVVEILVVIIVMAILITLAVVNVRSSQANARDTERATDVENTALRLESYYNTANSLPNGGGSRYPGTSAITLGSLQTMLPGFNFANMHTPGNNDETDIDLIPATNNNETPAGVSPQPTNATYVYQAINTDGTLCTDNLTQSCRRFNIFYRLEADGTIQIVKSKNR